MTIESFRRGTDLQDTSYPFIAEPGPHWLPLHRAPFFFFPAYAAPGEEFGSSMVALAQRTIPVGIETHIEQRYDQEVAIEHGLLSLRIDAEHGEFWLWGPDSEDGSGWADDVYDGVTDGGFGRPGVFFDFVASHKPKPQYKESAKILTEVAHSVWRRLEGAFDAAIQSGQAQIMGRTRSVLEPFSRIYPDQWRYFTVVHDDGDERLFEEDDRVFALAKGPDGEVIYSPMIAPVISADTSRVNAFTIGAENECLHWIIQKIKDNPDRPPAKESLWEEASQRWRGTLSKKGFGRARERAIRVVPGNRWAEPGRRK